MTTFNKLIILSLIICFAPTSFASGNTPSAAHIKSYFATFDYFSTNSENSTLTKLGYWTDSVEINETRLVRTVTRYSQEGSPDLSRTVAADVASLKPLFLQQRFGENLKSVFYTEFESNTLFQFLVLDERSSARSSSTSLAQSPLENNLQGVFAALLPFEDQTNITIAGYQAGAQAKTLEINFEVQGRATIEFDGTQIETWEIVEPSSQWKYWVTKSAPYLLRVEHPSPTGEVLVSKLTSFELKH